MISKVKNLPPKTSLGYGLVLRTLQQCFNLLRRALMICRGGSVLHSSQSQVVSLVTRLLLPHHLGSIVRLLGTPGFTAPLESVVQVARGQALVHQTVTHVLDGQGSPILTTLRHAVFLIGTTLVNELLAHQVLLDEHMLGVCRGGVWMVQDYRWHHLGLA